VEGQGSTVALDLPIPDLEDSFDREPRIASLIQSIEETTAPKSAPIQGKSQPDYVILQAPRA
jgi:hypothetical protein